MILYDSSVIVGPQSGVSSSAVNSSDITMILYDSSIIVGPQSGVSSSAATPGDMLTPLILQ